MESKILIECEENNFSSEKKLPSVCPVGLWMIEICEVFCGRCNKEIKEGNNRYAKGNKMVCVR